MRNHIAVKFITILLCSVFLFTSLVSGVGIIGLLSSGLYGSTIEEQHNAHTEQITRNLAHDVALRYACLNLGNCPESLVMNYFGHGVLYPSASYYGYDSEAWYCVIRGESGNLLGTYGNPPDSQAMAEYTFCINYFQVPDTMDVPPAEQMPAQTDSGENPEIDPSVPKETMWYPNDASEYVQAYNPETGKNEWYAVKTCQLQVDIFYEPDAFLPTHWDLLEIMMTYRYTLIWVLAGSLLGFVISFVFLACTAGRKPGSDEVSPAGLNCIPLDLYALLVCLGVAALFIIGQDATYWFDDQRMEYLAFLGAEAFVGSLLAVGFLFACAAQFKMKGAYWLRRSFIGICCIYGCKILVWFWNGFVKSCRWVWSWLPGLVKKGFRLIWTCICFLWNFVVGILRRLWAFVSRLLHRVGRWTVRIFSLLPLTWQWLLTALAMIFLIYLAFVNHGGWSLLLVLAAVALVLYGSSCFGILHESTKRMSKGDLDTKVSDQFLVGAFKEFAGDLNALADVAVVAAQKQMKSERMKAELVTNVSHDIKTPLTSIINYVDLLQKATTEDQRQQYLEVLSRQSQQMKKLIEDLMEMSKASTGNISVDIHLVEANEAITQALGEFSDKLAAAQLTPICTMPDKPIMIKADGRLVWRVLSNLLNNAVKYALPGTRLYVDLEAKDGKAQISLKNISKEQLNVSSDELMERFVRGDASRNTEGSGLGLNIAKSLMELQHGQLQLLVDGDLFKATLIFPGGNAE